MHASTFDTPSKSDLLRPKLSDLFVLTFCLSIFLAGCRYAFGSDYNFVLWSMYEFELFGYGVGVACCWAGVFRLLRAGVARGTFPMSAWQPGEVICAVEGTYYLIVAVIGGNLRYQAELAGSIETPVDLPSIAALYAVPPAVLCIGYLWLARQVTIPAWRIGAIAKLVSHAVMPMLLLFLVRAGTWEFDTTAISIGISLLMIACVVTPTGMILVAAWGDRRLTGVHWIHWLGVFAFAVIHFSRFSVEMRALIDFFET